MIYPWLLPCENDSWLYFIQTHAACMESGTLPVTACIHKSCSEYVSICFYGRISHCLYITKFSVASSPGVPHIASGTDFCDATCLNVFTLKSYEIIGNVKAIALLGSCTISHLDVRHMETRISISSYAVAGQNVFVDTNDTLRYPCEEAANC